MTTGMHMWGRAVGGMLASLVLFGCGLAGTDILVGGGDDDGDTAIDSAAETDTGTDSAARVDTSVDAGDGADTESDTETETDTAIPFTRTLLHRWSFNGDLIDSVGGSHAVIEGDAIGEGAATLTGTEVVLDGGGADGAQYVSLGENLVTGVGGPLTIELWATHLEIWFYARIFEFGASEVELLIMTWTEFTEIDGELVRWWDEDMQTGHGTNAPYRLGVPFHIVMTIDPNGGIYGNLRIGWHTAPAAAPVIGAEKGALETMDTLDDFDDADGWLGKSHYADDPVAGAAYDEVRIWAGRLTAEELDYLHALGPDTLP